MGTPTEWANGGDDTQWLSVASGLHILGNLEHLTGYLGGDTAGGLGYLQTTENISLSVGKGLTLLKGDAGSKTVPIGTNQVDKLEHDLLFGHDAGGLPSRERSLGTGNGSFHLFLGALGNTSNQVVGSRIEQVNPCLCARSSEFVVDKVGGVDGGGNAFVGLGE